MACSRRRTTNQRIKILHYLKSAKTHPTAEMVYKEVAKELPAISLATVYRNLNQMAEQGKILRLEINGEYRFDGDTCHHQHFVCRKCGRITDIMDEKTSTYALSRLRLHGLDADCITICYKGLCKKCKEANGGR